MTTPSIEIEWGKAPIICLWQGPAALTYSAGSNEIHLVASGLEATPEACGDPTVTVSYALSLAAGGAIVID